MNLAIPARAKVEVTLNFLATGSTYNTLVSDDAFQSHLIISTVLLGFITDTRGRFCFKLYNRI